MPGADDKRFYRELKRKIKKAGNKRRRRQGKRDLADNPAEAHWSEFDYGTDSSEWLNGIDGEGKNTGRGGATPGGRDLD
jgi:hypothetical protein